MLNLVFALALLIAPVRASAEDKLVFAVDMIRHGDRTPISEIPKSPHRWEEGLGQLTAKGMRQAYELGARARGEYVQRYHLLSPDYKSGTVFVRSSDIDRTLMTAQSFLMGLYPNGTGPVFDGKPALPGSAQPIPIHTVASHEETLLYPDGPLYKYDKLRARYVASTPQWRQKNAALQPNFARWSEATGITITDIYQLKPLGDTLFVRQLYNVPPPQGLSAQDVQEIIDAGRWAFIAGFQPEAVGRATGSALLKQVAGFMQDVSREKTDLKYVLFSAHDSTLMSEMSALGAPLAETPHYASRLNFAMFSAGQESFIVKVTYNDRPVAVKGCGPDACTLSQFLALLKH